MNLPTPLHTECPESTESFWLEKPKEVSSPGILLVVDATQMSECDRPKIGHEVQRGVEFPLVLLPAE